MRNPFADKNPSPDFDSKNTIEEWISGKQILSPRPTIPHAGIASRLGTILMAPYQFGSQGPGGWFFLFEPEVHLGDPPHKLVPDLAAWKIEHFSEEMELSTFISLAPDWVCEILSPSTSWVDKVQKLPIYAQYHVPYVWLIDPITQLLDVMQLEKGHYLLLGTYGERTTVDLPPFGPIRLDMLWRKPSSTQNE